VQPQVPDGSSRPGQSCGPILFGASERARGAPRRACLIEEAGLRLSQLAGNNCHFSHRKSRRRTRSTFRKQQSSQSSVLRRLEAFVVNGKGVDSCRGREPQVPFAICHHLGGSPMRWLPDHQARSAVGILWQLGDCTCCTPLLQSLYDRHHAWPALWGSRFLMVTPL
jgi:hypothetical protein